MSANISFKLKSSLQGALAGGGDPATSPLYVFGPFLTLIVGAGVASVTFGASIWMAVLTVVAVSAMYRYVMTWVIDGSGGSGLSEEEFGSWAVKINAAITVIEYTLTFLVSIAALVTFIADRAPVLNERVLFFDYRALTAVGFSLLVGFLVNRGPQISAAFFGPATAAVLLLLWVMIVTVVVRRGLQLPNFDLRAFSPEYAKFTFGGYARILALMTGIEIFANLVAAYQGTAREKSRKAFGSLVIVMGTTAMTMVIVGPAILATADVSNHEVSVFTQTMDALLPRSLSIAGTLIGIAVLLSAAAASAQGIQSLCLGLRNRHYIPAYWGQRNRFDVPSLPVWSPVAVVVSCFIFFGTREETYLALYAAGVFVLLSMTGWATTKRLARMLRTQFRKRELGALALTVTASLLSTSATIIIFEERFFDGAWMYLVLLPAFYFVFSNFRRKLGSPRRIEDRLKIIMSSAQSAPTGSRLAERVYDLRSILVPLDGTGAAEAALPVALRFARAYRARIELLNVTGSETSDLDATDADRYLTDVATQIAHPDLEITTRRVSGRAEEAVVRLANDDQFDLVVLTTFGQTPTERILKSSVPYKVIFQTTPPLILIRPVNEWKSRRSSFKKILVPLDGSPIAEQVLPYVLALAGTFQSEVVLLSVPEEDGNTELVAALERYVAGVATPFEAAGIPCKQLVIGSGPARTILSVSDEEGADLIALSSHGKGGVGRQTYVKLGSAVDRVISTAPCPVFFVSAVEPDEDRAPVAPNDAPADAATN